MSEQVAAPTGASSSQDRAANQQATIDIGRGIKFRRDMADAVPVIDFSVIYSSDPEQRKKIAAPLRKACREVGFFYLANHGFPQVVIDRAHGAMQRFFDMPREEKMKIHYQRSKMHRGYVGGGDIVSDYNLKGKDHHEAVELAHDLPETDPDYLRGNQFYGPNVWPENPADFRWALGTYFDAQVEMGKYMMRAFALALDLPETYFDKMYTKPVTRLRACFYPPQPADFDIRNIGIGAHRDYEIFTTVAQTDEPGLQVLGTNGDWIEIPPIPGTFVINLGDLMQRWTNDIFLSRPHRVINLNKKDRYSIVQFFGLDYDVEFDAFPTCKSAENPAKYPTITCGRNTEEYVSKTYYGGLDE